MDRSTLHFHFGGANRAFFPYVQVMDLPYICCVMTAAEAELTEGHVTRALREQMLADFRRHDPADGLSAIPRLAEFWPTPRGKSVARDMKVLKIRTVVADLPQEPGCARWARRPTPIPWPGNCSPRSRPAWSKVTQKWQSPVSWAMKFPDAGLSI